MPPTDPSMPYRFAASERPAFPGSPYTPNQSLRLRLVYFFAAMVVGTGASFGNALVNVNASTIAGSLGLYAVQAAVLPAIYIAFNASANLSIVKARAAFGIPALVLTAQVAYIVSAIVEVLWPSYAAAIVTRAINGVSTATLATLTVYYLLEVFPAKSRALALVIGLGVTQLSTPIARLIPVELLGNDHWHGLHLFELAQGLLLFVVVAAVPLPPTDRVNTFEPLDFLSILLFVAALVPFCEVLALGRSVWWTDAPWIGRALVASLVLGSLAAAIELVRRNPLVRFSAIGTAGLLRFAGMAVLIRLALAEQTYGSVGFLTAGGLNNDQLHGLFWLVLVAQIAGIVVAALTLSAGRLPYQMMAACLVIAGAAALDSYSDARHPARATLCEPGADRLRHEPVHRAGDGDRTAEDPASPHDRLSGDADHRVQLEPERRRARRLRAARQPRIHALRRNTRRR